MNERGMVRVVMIFLSDQNGINNRINEGKIIDRNSVNVGPVIGWIVFVNVTLMNLNVETIGVGTEHQESVVLIILANVMNLHCLTFLCYLESSVVD